MKQAIAILLFGLSSLTSATTYYVSLTGNDSANGLTESTPWKSISKVNSSFAVIKPGDKILFKSGETFYGTIKITKSGAAGSPITIGAYGTGGKPVITGYKTLTSWTDAGGGIYSTPVTCGSSPEMVTINGVQYAMGRWPNSAVWPETQTWASIDSFVGVTSITDAELGTTGINWTGAELVARNSNRNRISIYQITSQSGNTLVFSGGSSSYQLAANWGYFIQNDKRALDKFGEWYYDQKASIFYMYFGSENPANQSVRVTTLDYLIEFSTGITYCNIDNLSLNGVNNTAIYGNWNHNTIIKDCDINSCGYYGIFLNKSTYPNISNCIIDHCNDNGMYIVEDCDNALISNNTISNIGLFPGMGQGLFESCIGILVRGSDNTIVESNDLINTGYTSLRYSGNNIVIRKNYINNFCFIKEDGGAISYASGSAYSNIKVLNNIVINGLGSPAGRPAGTGSWVSGIYLDYYTTGGVEISDNIVANVKNMGGILISGSQNVIIKNNTIFDCSSGVRMQELGNLGTPPRNITMTGNIIFSKTATYTPLLLYSVNNDLDQFGYFNYNYYARPLDNAKPVVTGISGVVTARTLAEWQTFSGMDLNSKISPITLKDTADIDFYFNPTESEKVFSLSKPMIDVEGTKYQSSITLNPLTSAVLMVDPNPAPAGIAPAYISASFPTYPTILVMNYSLTLANIVPAFSAFTVMVNSVPGTVKSVIVDGTKVRLYLESGVKYGDIVTVSYTKPAANPLQSVAGIPAASISNQPVTNNITGVPPVYLNSIIPTYPTIMLMNYDQTLSNIVPPASAFTVMVNSVPISVNSVIISEKTVRLYLSGGVKYGDIVTVSYTKPATFPLQSATGVPAASISNQQVTNNIIGIPPVYVSSIIPTYPNIMLMNYDQTLANIVPAASAFSVMVNSVPIAVNSVVIGSTTVRLYLASGVQYGDIVTVSYTRPATNPLQSALGVPAASISNQPVTNNITGIPPVYVSSIIPTYPTIMLMYYDLTLANVVPATSAFSVKVNSVTRAVNSVVVGGTTVRLYLTSGVQFGDIVTVSYTKPATNPLQSELGVPAASISNQPVTNKIVSAPSEEPVLVDLFSSKPDAIKGFEAEDPSDSYSRTEKITLYPNPAREMINVTFAEPATENQVLKIYDLSGKLYYLNRLDPGIRNMQIPVSFNQGIYYVKLLTGNLTIITQKLMVVR